MTRAASKPTASKPTALEPKGTPSMSATEVAKIDRGTATVVPLTEIAAMMEVINRATSDPNTNIDKMERLMGMYERMQMRNAEQAFAQAMNRAQTEMRPISTDSANSSTKSKYASYGALDKAMRPIYTTAGFALSFDTADCPLELHVRVVCYVMHTSGHSKRYQADIPCDGKGARGNDVMTRTHANGSAFSYGMRYLLKLIFNIAVGDDDDGNAAGGHGTGSNATPGSIAPDQVQHINDLIKRNNANINKFCVHFQIEAVPDLPAKKFSMAVEMLNAFGLNNTKKKEAA